MAPPPSHKVAAITLQTPGLQWHSSKADRNTAADRHSQSYWLAHANSMPAVTATLKDGDGDRPKIYVKVPWGGIRGLGPEKAILQAVNHLVASSLRTGSRSILDDLEVLSLRSLHVGQISNHSGGMRTVTSFIPRARLEFIDLHDVVLRDMDADAAFLRTFEHNTTIISVCHDCTPHGGHQVCKAKRRRSCPIGVFSEGMPLPGGDDPYWERRFTDWYWSARVASICARNAALRSRVHQAVFRVLPFARILLRGQSRAPIPLPYHIVENIAFFASGGYLTRTQLRRLLDHAADADETQRIAHILGEAAAQRGKDHCEQLRDEWLYNGGFWWELGYDAARDELEQHGQRYHTRSGALPPWPKRDDVDAQLKLFAFTPPQMRWSHAEAEFVRNIMNTYA